MSSMINMTNGESCIEIGSEVMMHVKIMLKDKSIAQDTKEENAPVNVLIGEGAFTENFEKHLLGLKVGEKNTFIVPPEDSFGESNPRNIQKMMRSQFPKTETLEPGLIFMFTQKNGQEIPGIVKNIEDNQVVIDFNHPLAGQDLIFEVVIIDIETPIKH